MDQKEAFIQGFIHGHDHTLFYNLLKDTQYWIGRHARLAKFVDHALEDLTRLLKEAYVDMCTHNTMGPVFHFVSVCIVVFERFEVGLLIAH